MEEFARVSLEPLEILYWDAFQFNIATVITNVQLQPNVIMEFAVLSVQAQEIAWTISFAFRACANQLANQTQLVPTSNSARTTFVFRKPDVPTMKNAN